jgi:oxepin-CoA hydrolase/3-oxo-5,6-dehydrosuberyl-CoA semialdehyde dehydrogenase
MKNEKIELRLNNLTETSDRQFGIMYPQHMVEHLILTVKLSYGRIKIPEFEPNEKQLLQKQALIYSDIPFPRGIRAPGLGEELLDLRFADLETSKSHLLKSMEEYDSFFESNPESQTLHPRFGKLTHQEWERFHKKHFEHHFRQFGI